MRWSRTGFTLVELLVVIAIIGIVVAMLLPAVQASREAGRRMQCTANLRQVALATHNYEASNGCLPIGAYDCCWGSWMVALLPYVEQDQAFLLYDQRKPTDYNTYWADMGMGGVPTDLPFTRYCSAQNIQVTGKRYAVYTCPSDQPNASWGITQHNYVANFGNTGEMRVCNGGHRVLRGAVQFVPYTTPTPPTAFEDITDGLSDTLLFSETVQGHDFDLRGFSWWNGGLHFETFMPPNSESTRLARSRRVLRFRDGGKSTLHWPDRGHSGYNTPPAAGISAASTRRWPTAPSASSPTASTWPLGGLSTTQGNDVVSADRYRRRGQGKGISPIVTQ